MEFVDFEKFDMKEQELIRGLLNNRGYTFLSTSTEFETRDESCYRFSLFSNKLYLVTT